MEDKRNLLVTLADRNYIQQAKQLFSSVYWNAGWKGDYMLLSHEIPEKELKWFRNKGILVRKCKPLEKNKISGGFPPTLLNKFYLFTPEFKKWKNIVYLDADIIVRASLDRLTKVKGFGAVLDLGLLKIAKNINQRNKKLFLEIQKNYQLNTQSFNAGVLIFNTDIISKNSFTELRRLFKKYSQISIWAEQAVFNLYFYKKWKRLPLVYDVLVSYLSYVKNLKGIILHFVGFGNKKPWDITNSFYEEWKSNLERAELIDLKNIPKGKKWSKFCIYWYSLYLWIKRYISILFYRKIFFYITYNLNRFIGKFGIFLKKHNPKLYHKLKKIKDGR